jgi:hypothetical protein
MPFDKADVRIQFGILSAFVKGFCPLGEVKRE